MVILPKSDAKKRKFSLVAPTGRTGCIHWLHWLHPLVALVAPRTQNLENIGGVTIKIFWKVTKHNLSYS